MSGSESLRIDEFLFGIEFFCSGNRLKDCLMLFQELDANRDGLLDQVEFDHLFAMSADGKANDSPHMMDKTVEEEDLGNYMHGGYNTYNKRPLAMGEMLQLPQFAGQVRHKLEMRRRGKEVGKEITS